MVFVKKNKKRKANNLVQLREVVARDETLPTTL